MGGQPARPAYFRDSPLNELARSKPSDVMSSERDRWRRSEQAGEALRTQHVCQHRESRNHHSTDNEADEVFGHLAFFQSFASGPPVP